MTKKTRIALVLDARFGYARGEMRGVIAFARENELPWVFAGGTASAGTWRMLRQWKPQGIIGALPARISHLENVPVVTPLLPFAAGAVMLDNGAIGRLAADHLLSRGFRHLAFVGERRAAFSTERRDGFRAQWRLALGNAPDASFETLELAYEKGGDWRPGMDELTAWLTALPKPAGILASRDQRALEIVQVCKALQLRIPEDFAVMGVDNDDLLCEMSDPPLSSVGVPWELIGRAMGASMHRLLSGKPPLRHPPLVQPGEVAVRRSTDVYAISDEVVIRACRYIQEHAGAACSVAAIARAAFVSRRGIERRFRKALGRSPRHEVERTRFRKAQKLLRDTNLSVGQVAEQSGFSCSARLIAACHRLAETTPGAYRALFHPPRGWRKEKN